MSKRTHILVPDELVHQIDDLVGKRGRSGFIVQAAEKELQRLRQIRALEAAAGTWSDKDHPELGGGAAAWVKTRRSESERRFRNPSGLMPACLRAQSYRTCRAGGPGG